MFLLVITVRFPAVDRELAEAGADAMVAALAAQPQTRRLRWARSTEDQDLRVLVAEFDSAAAYRSATSPMEVRATLIPWLSGATEPAITATSAVYEVDAVADDGVLSLLDPIVPAPGR